MSDLITISNLSVAFPTREGLVRAVNDVSLSIPRGKTIGLVGESGCGKSVTAMSIMRLIAAPGRIVNGSILLHGKDGHLQEITTQSDAEMRKIRGGRIGMIFQEPMTSLNPVFTIGDQIAESLRIHRDMDYDTARRRVIDLLDMVKMPAARTRIDDYPHQFSGGMRQRVMIAMALACEPELLIADEPTTALDVTIQAQILDLLRQLQAANNMSILMITHDLGVIAEMADHVTVMYASQVVESASVKDLFANPMHPYTVGLFRSRPQPGSEATLYSIPGMVPSAANFPSGCYFHPRCAWCQVPRCTTESSALREIKTDHFVRCHFAGEIDFSKPLLTMETA